MKIVACRIFALYSSTIDVALVRRSTSDADPYHITDDVIRDKEDLFFLRKNSSSIPILTDHPCK